VNEDGGKPRVLFVDDEPNVLSAFVRSLRAAPFEVRTALNGHSALETIRRDGPFAAIVSDLRMPGMDGVAMLRRVREMAPDTVRVLLTGQPDLEDAIAAINQGSIFRFITKPCPPPILRNMVETAVAQHRLLVAERELLEQTLHGSIRALTEILSLVSPAAFGRATRLRRSVSELLSSFDIREKWHVEVAAMVSQIGCVILPPHTLESVYEGRPLSEEEQAMIERMPGVVEQVLGNIPRLEPVLEILAYQHKNYDGTGMPLDGVAGEAIPWGSRALRVVVDYDLLESQGNSTAMAFDVMRGRTGRYDPAILERLAQIHKSTQEFEVRELPVRMLAPGMVLAQDVRTRQGSLVIARGQEVTPSLVERLRNFSSRLGGQEPIRVVIGKVGAPATADPTLWPAASGGASICSLR
jgi:response regulator RpfG family c-di-GMP phosphodiesterase